jgi:hypothetical protein
MRGDAEFVQHWGHTYSRTKLPEHRHTVTSPKTEEEAQKVVLL